MVLYLFHVSQSANKNWDTYSDFVCAAHSELDARNMNPDGSGDEPWGMLSWVSSADLVTVRLIGKAASFVERGVIRASFHAG